MEEWSGWGKSGRDEGRSERDEWRSGMDGGRVDGMGVEWKGWGRSGRDGGGVEGMGEEWGNLTLVCMWLNLGYRSWSYDRLNDRLVF